MRDLQWRWARPTRSPRGAANGLRRATLARAALIYRERFEGGEGRIPATFEILSLPAGRRIRASRASARAGEGRQLEDSRALFWSGMTGRVSRSRSSRWGVYLWLVLYDGSSVTAEGQQFTLVPLPTTCRIAEGFKQAPPAFTVIPVPFSSALDGSIKLRGLRHLSESRFRNSGFYLEHP